MKRPDFIYDPKGGGAVPLDEAYDFAEGVAPGEIRRLASLNQGPPIYMAVSPDGVPRWFFNYTRAELYANWDALQGLS